MKLLLALVPLLSLIHALPQPSTGTGTSKDHGTLPVGRWDPEGTFRTIEAPLLNSTLPSGPSSQDIYYQDCYEAGARMTVSQMRARVIQFCQGMNGKYYPANTVANIEWRVPEAEGNSGLIKTIRIMFGKERGRGDYGGDIWWSAEGSRFAGWVDPQQEGIEFIIIRY